jgi:hypothetical protein
LVKEKQRLQPTWVLYQCDNGELTDTVPDDGSFQAQVKMFCEFRTDEKSWSLVRQFQAETPVIIKLTGPGFREWKVCFRKGQTERSLRHFCEQHIGRHSVLTLDGAPLSPEMDLSEINGEVTVSFDRSHRRGSPPELWLSVRVVPVDGRYPSDCTDVLVKRGFRVRDVVSETVAGPDAARFRAFVVRKDRLGLDRMESSQAAAVLAGRGPVIVQPDLPDLVPIAVLEGKGARVTPTGTVFQMRLALPLRLDGANLDLRKQIFEFKGEPIRALFVLRKDGRTIQAGQCNLDVINCVCVVLEKR